MIFINDFAEDRLLFNRSAPGVLGFDIVEGRKDLTTPASKVLGRDGFKGMGVDFADLNADGRLDFFVSNIAAEWALEESHFAFVSGGVVGDFARGIAPYRDESESLGLSRSGWAWDAKFGDFDNDGVPELVQGTGFLKGSVNRWPELHELAMGNDELIAYPAVWPSFRPGLDDLSGADHNPFFVRATDGRYYDLAAEVGLAEPSTTRGVATGDADGDGDLDFAIANQWKPSRFYRNDLAEPGGSLVLNLLLPVGGSADADAVVPHDSATRRVGSPALGAEVRVRLADGHVLVGFVDGGNGHSGGRSHQVHFGVPDRLTGPGGAVSVGIRWRSRNGHLRRREMTLPRGTHTLMLGVTTATASETENDRKDRS